MSDVYDEPQNQSARIDGAGQVVRRFQVHGSKVRLCQMAGQLEDDGRKNAIQPGVLPDFPDSEVSEPLYGNELLYDSRQQAAARKSAFTERISSARSRISKIRNTR